MKKTILALTLLTAVNLNAQQVLTRNWVGNLQDEYGNLKYFKEVSRGMGCVSAESEKRSINWTTALDR